MAAVQQGVILEPRNPLVKLTLGRVFESRGQLAEARAATRKQVASTARGRHRRSPRSRFSCARAMPRPRPRDSTHCPARRSSSGEAQLLLGRLLLRKEDWNGAKAALDSAAAALPGLAEAQAALGTGRLQRG